MATFPRQDVSAIPPRPSLAEAQAMLPTPKAKRLMPLWTDSELGQHVLIAQKATELDTLRRKEREAWNATALQLETAQEPEQRKALYEGYLKQTAALGSQSPEVNMALRSYLDQALPMREGAFNQIDRDIAIARVTDEFKFNLEGTYQTRDEETFQTMLAKGEALGILTPEKRQYLTENFEVNADLTDMQVLLDRGDPESLGKAIDLARKYDEADLAGKKLKGAHRIATEQRSAIRRMEVAAKQAAAENTDALVSKVIFDMDANRAKPAAKRLALGEQYRALLERAGLPPSEARVSLDRIDQWERGEDVKTDKFVESELRDRAGRLNTDSTQAEVESVRKAVFGAADRLSITDFRALMDLTNNRMEKIRADAIGVAVGLAVDHGVVVKGFDDGDFQRALVFWANTQKVPPTGREIAAKAADVALHWRTPTYRRPQFTPEKVAQVLGQLEAKQAPEGKTLYGSKVIGLVTTEFGPYWQTLVPDAVGIIRRQYPDVKIPPAPKEPGRGLEKPTTKAEYDAVPAGTPYMHPDGTTKVKS